MARPRPKAWARTCNGMTGECMTDCQRAWARTCNENERPKKMCGKQPDCLKMKNERLGHMKNGNSQTA